MPNRSHILSFVVSGFLLGASVLSAQSSSQTQMYQRFPHLTRSLRPTKPLPPQVAYLPIDGFKLLDSSTGWVLFSHQVEDEDDPIPANSQSDWTFYVAATQDAGKTWTTIQIPAMREKEGDNLAGGGEIIFGDRLNGWMLVGHVSGGIPFAGLLHSSNGGLHWEWVNAYPEISGEMSAVGADRLFVDGDGPRGNQLFGTWDAGRTFQEIFLAPPPTIGQNMGPQYGSPIFPTPQTGYETVTYQGPCCTVPSSTVLFTTSDGGHTWTTGHIFDNLVLQDPSISSTIVDSTWVIPSKPIKGTLSLIRLPISRGQTSAPPYQVDDFSRCGLDFWNSTEGWARCNGAPLFSTDDGGSTWTVIHPRAVVGTGTLTDAPVTPPPAIHPAPPPTSTIVSTHSHHA